MQVQEELIRRSTGHSEQDNSVVAEIERKLEELQKQLLIRANSKKDYNYIADEIYRLREEKHNALAEDAEKKVVGHLLKRYWIGFQQLRSLVIRMEFIKFTQKFMVMVYKCGSEVKEIRLKI